MCMEGRLFMRITWCWSFTIGEKFNLSFCFSKLFRCSQAVVEDLYSLDICKWRRQFHSAYQRPFLYLHRPIALPRRLWLCCCNSTQSHFSHDYVSIRRLCNLYHWSYRLGSLRRTLYLNETTETNDNSLDTDKLLTKICENLREKLVRWSAGLSRFDPRWISRMRETSFWREKSTRDSRIHFQTFWCLFPIIIIIII